MKHPLDRIKISSDTDLKRVVGMKKDTLPNRASLDLQKRSRTKGQARRAAEFVRIAREDDPPIWQR